MRKSCVIYDSWAVQIVSLPPEMAGEYTQKILRYAFFEEEPTFDDPALAAMFASVKNRLDDDLAKYQAKVGRAKTISQRSRNEIDTKSHEVATKSYEIDGDNVNVNVNDNENIKDIKRTSHKFVKPTLDDIRAYCLERKNNIDPERFFDFYESKGWKVGNQSMKDWKAAVRNWERRNKDDAAPSSQTDSKIHNFNGERTYDFEELEKEVLGKGNK